MTNGAAGGAAAAAAAATVARAIKASGAIVSIEAHDFTAILAKMSEPLVVFSRGGFLSPKYQYLASYKGLIFHTKNGIPLELPSGCEVIQSRKIWVPG